MAQLIGGFAFKGNEYTELGSRIIRISDISEESFISKNVVRYPFSDKYKQYIIENGDILIAMTGGTVGKSLYVKKLPETNMLLNQRVAIVRVYCLTNKYINCVLKSNYILDIIKHSKNSTNDNISMADIYNFLIPLPPLKEQERIIQKIELLFNKIKG